MPGHRGREYSRLEWPNRGPRPPARPLPRTPVAVAPAPRSVRYDPSMTMKSVDPAHLRSVVLAGHAGGGKTTLAEHLLFQAGAIQRLGKVDAGSAHLDYEPEEQKRQQTLSLAVATFEHDGTRITLVDTPGYPDFVAEVVSGFAAADGALFVADASGTVEAGLETGVALGRSTGRAACFFINKCGKEHATTTAAHAALRGRFGNKIAPLHVASGAGEAFEGYVDLVHRKAYRFDGGSEVEVPIPDGLADEVAKRRDQLLEAAAEADDDVLTKYLEGEELSDEELDACLHRGVRDSILAPVLVGSAAKGIGINALLDAFIRYMPTAAEEPAVAAKNAKTGADATIDPDPSGQLVARVVKTAADPFVGRLTYLRVLSGTLHGQAHAWNANREEDERIGQLLLLHGKDQEPIGELTAGEIGAVAKLTVTETGDTLSSKDAPIILPPLDFPVPTLTVAIEPQTKADLDKMGAALQRMLEEEPSARVERSATGEQLLVATGEAHIAVIGERLKRKFGAAIVTRTPKIPYRETIRGTTKVEGRYKKQTGGHGMFGHVWLEIEPNPGGGVRGRPCRLSAVGLQGDALRRLVPHGRLQRALVQDRRVDGAQEGRPRVQARAARADHDGRREGPRGVHGRRQPRPQHAPRARPRDGHVRRDAGRFGAGPPGRVVHVRHGAAVTDSRPRDVHGRAGSLRRGPVAHRRESDRRPQEGSRDDRRPLTRISCCVS